MKKRGNIDHQTISLSLTRSTRKIFKVKHFEKPLLSSPDVKNFLHTMGFEARLITLIERKGKFLWLARGIYQRKLTVFTVDFIATLVRWHNQSPNWSIACPHSKIIINGCKYHIVEQGPQIFLEMDQS